MSTHDFIESIRIGIMLLFFPSVLLQNVGQTYLKTVQGPDSVIFVIPHVDLSVTQDRHVFCRFN